MTTNLNESHFFCPRCGRRLYYVYHGYVVWVRGLRCWGCGFEIQGD